jgi:hypothetical protein
VTRTPHVRVAKTSSTILDVFSIPLALLFKGGIIFIKIEKYKIICNMNCRSWIMKLLLDIWHLETFKHGMKQLGNLD